MFNTIFGDENRPGRAGNAVLAPCLTVTLLLFGCGARFAQDEKVPTKGAAPTLSVEAWGE